MKFPENSTVVVALFSNAFAQHATSDQIAVCKAVQPPIALQCIQEVAFKAGLEIEAVLVSDRVGRPHDQS